MSVRAFPETRDEPRKRILLIPPLLIIGGLFLAWLHPMLAFIGSVLALAGVLTVFLVGMVFADLWASSRRTKDIIKAREKRMRELEAEEESDVDDPFLDALEENDS
jgi:membrane protein implicated in regulation of membrane protease activity